MSSGAQLRWRVECPHGRFDTEAKPQAAWCLHCRKPLEAVALTARKTAFRRNRVKTRS